MALVRHRRPNFNQDELRALVRGVEKRSSVIGVRVGPQMAGQVKKEAWQEITDEVNAASVLHVPRTVEEVQRRYRDYKHRSRKKARFQTSYEDSIGDVTADNVVHLSSHGLSDAEDVKDRSRLKMENDETTRKSLLRVIELRGSNDSSMSPSPSQSPSQSPLCSVSPQPPSSSQSSSQSSTPTFGHRLNESGQTTCPQEQQQQQQQNQHQQQNQPPVMEWMVTLQERLIIAVEQLVEDFCEASAKASADRQRIASALEGILTRMENDKPKEVSR